MGGGEGCFSIYVVWESDVRMWRCYWGIVGLTFKVLVSTLTHASLTEFADRCRYDKSTRFGPYTTVNDLSSNDSDPELCNNSRTLTSC